MNIFIGMGRLTRDPELKTTSSNIAVATFSIAIDRKYKNASGNKQTDFLNCVAWRSSAEFIAKYFGKGDRISIVGSVQSRSYEANDGTRRNVVEVAVEEAGFVDSKSGAQQASEQVPDDSAMPFDV